MKLYMKYLTFSISLGICVVLGTGNRAAAQQPGKTPLTETATTRQAQYQATLTALQAEITKALPSFDDQQKTAFQKAREDVKRTAAAVTATQ